MSYLLAYITIFVLLFTLITIWKTYKYKALLHPGFFFCVLWIVGVTGFTILTLSFKQSNLFFPKHVNELNSFILFTSLCFLLFSRMKSKVITQSESRWSVFDFQPLYKYFVIASLISAIAMFIIREATFDFSSSRDATVEFETALFLGERSQTLLFTIYGIFLSSNIILGIFAGFLIGEKFRNNKKVKIWFFLLLLPILTQLIMMLIVGGRIDFINILRALIFGIGISISNGISQRIFKKLIIYGLLSIFIFTIYSNYNYKSRVGNYQNNLYKENVVLRQFSSVIEYFSSTYTGYQLRRDDFVTQKLEYGEKTFAGILFLRIPFSGTLGLKKTSVGEMVGLEEYSMKKMFLDLQSQNALHFSSVSSIYLLFYDDFGYFGTFIFIFFLVWITQRVFINWFVTPNKSFFSIFFLFILFVLWSNSIMDPVFATGFFRSTLYSIATIQFSLYIRNKFLKIH